MKRSLTVPMVLAVLLVSFGAVTAMVQPRPTEAVEAPMFEVDPFWPKPLPNHWVMGWTVGVAVDAQDHVWVTHRAATLEPAELYGRDKKSACCFPAPPVLEFDQDGKLLRHWGGPGQGYDFPESPHGIFVDFKDNVWLNGNGPKDHHVVKFTQDGKFLLQIGKPGMSKGSNDTENVQTSTKAWVDQASNEVFVADGYGNRRIAVFDADTGKYKRHWGAYGARPDDSVSREYIPGQVSKQLRTVHGVAVSNDGLVYVADRGNDRIQVFRKDGTFVKEGFVAPATLGDGSVFDVDFSTDPQQKYLYVPDGSNHKVWILLRDTLEVVTAFGDGGRQPGAFYATHNVAVDSKGNMYTVETRRGQRVQKFNYRGIGRVAKEQGILWPKGSRPN